MTGGAHTFERGNPGPKPKYGHHHGADRLPDRRRDALGAHGSIPLSEQSDYGLAKLAHRTRPRPSVCLFSAKLGHRADVGYFSELRRGEPGDPGVVSEPSPEGHGAFCPAAAHRGSKICSGLTVITFPHQLSVWAAAMSARDTRGFDPSRLFTSENTPC